MKKFVILAAIFVLAACELPTAEDQKAIAYGKGEQIVLRFAGEGACLDCFNYYKHRDLNKAFYLSTTGAFSFAIEKGSVAEAKAEASASCQAKNKNEPCKALMINDSFAWVE